MFGQVNCEDSRVDGLKEELRVTNLLVNVVQRDVEQRLKGLDAVAASVQELSVRMTNMQTKMDARFEDMQTKMDARFDAADRRMDAMQTQLGAMEKRLDGVDQRFDKMQTNLDQSAVWTRIVIVGAVAAAPTAEALRGWGLQLLAKMAL
jgi:flagellin-like hook-associated protein FlgL